MSKEKVSTAILKFWHGVEFFIPYDLQENVLEHKDSSWAVRTIDGKALACVAEMSSGDFWKVQRIPNGKKLSGFDVYLGIFDKSDLALITQELLGGPSSEFDGQDQTERGDLEGATCIARIQLNEAGQLLEKNFSVSTVPWALGKLRRKGLPGLAFDEFIASQETLKEKLKNFVAERRARKVEQDVEGEEALGITASDLICLQDIFYAWADFEPTKFDHRKFVIRAKAAKKQKEPVAAADEDGSDDASSGDEDITIDILNSFFAKDIERIVESRVFSDPLKKYLSPKHEQPVVDVYSNDGRLQLWNALSIKGTPCSHWLSNPFHSMSLMQQFSINSAFDQLAAGGLFSVNGPPGTGKTTLLRDIFAENITRRARVLARLASPDAAFSGERIRIEFSDTKTTTLYALIPELTGYEMVVVSSNNSAVENISNDLPKCKALGECCYDGSKESDWRHIDGQPKVTYLQQVAQKLISQKEDGSFAALKPDDVPWGLISCALGNYGNRRRFVSGVFGPVKDEGTKPQGYDPDLHQSMWDWRNRYGGCGFGEAQAQFLACQQKVDRRREELKRYIETLLLRQRHTEESYISAELAVYGSLQQQYSRLQERLGKLRLNLRDRISDIDDLSRLLPTLKKPSWFDRFFRRERYRDDVARVERVTQEYEAAVLEKIRLTKDIDLDKNELSRVDAELKEATRQVEKKRAQWMHMQADEKRLALMFPQIEVPESLQELEKNEWQISGLWGDPELNRLRSELFALALQLHEAWLAEASTTSQGFGGNLFAIDKYVGGARLCKPQLAAHIWQSLFMVVPIVSSTFASVANQFRDLGPSSLGWLFIDEAGQAVPQAAVGALWRSKRAVVVGDPLQIEPVFTVPIKLIDAIATSCQLPDDPYVLPHKSSVQNRADAANQLGTFVSQADGSRQWIGTPLRVHRRCNNPMFDVSNEIAYEHKMVLGEASDRSQRSFWVCVKGAAVDKQVVREQVELVTEAVIAIYRAKGQLPALYVISPFKRIKEAIKASLSNQSRWQKTLGICEPPKKKALEEWCRKHIGTVHTFQGKEEAMVWLVLGCDTSTPGAVAWACAKPNILNVALTRAKKRFFFIGDHELWGGKRFFQSATPTRFPRISTTDFLHQVTGLQQEG